MKELLVRYERTNALPIGAEWHELILSVLEVMILENSNNSKLALNKALRYLAIRDRSVVEMKNYLKRQNFLEENITNTIDYLIEKEYLDDMKFAKTYSSLIMRKQKYGLNKIKAQLLNKGISWDIIEQAVNYSESEEIIVAKKVMENKFRGNFDELNWKKIARVLTNKGFSERIIKKVLNEYYKT